MQTLVVVGLQWGDEGKGKLIDYISEDFDVVVRFQGGSNAGHTVITGDSVHKFRIIPTGAVRGKKVVIGNGVVLDPAILLNEISNLQNAGISVDLLISDRAHLITPYHIQIDELQEIAKGSKKVGTTKRGIGPTYSDKMLRTGVRVCDFLDTSSNQWDQMQDSAEKRIKHLYGEKLDFDCRTSEEEYRSMMSKLSRYSGDATEYLHKVLDDGKRVLFEGAQGTLLDIDHGTYPFVTSSNCISAAAATGTGIAINKIDAVLGITKAYTTRVGTGPFPTELRNELGMTIAERGKEFGTVTGRPRRCGWLDLVALRYAVRINGSEHLAVTKLDVLNELAKVKVCVAYNLDGTEISSFPSSSTTLNSVSPVYEELDGWKDIELVPYEELPGSLREYLSKIESFTESKISVLSVGPDRNETITTPNNSIIDA